MNAPGEHRTEDATHAEEEMLRLCRLIVGMERKDLHAALRVIMDRTELTQRLAAVLADAIRQAQAQDPRFADTIAPIISKGVHETVRRDAAAFGKALAPAMGPAIRQSVLLMIRGFVESFERMLAQRLSARSIKWRYEAWRTGKSFGEIVFLKTLVYRVEHVFWIHRATGVLLTRFSAPDAPVADPDLVSGMLTAIQDFVGDAFNAEEGDALGAFQVGDLNMIVEGDKETILAGVVRGMPTQRVRLRLRETLEQLQLDYATSLESFDGETEIFESAMPFLAGCMERKEIDSPSQLDSKQRGKSKPSHLRRWWLLYLVLVVATVVVVIVW